MAQWRKVIVSGSNSELNNITSSGDFHLKSDGAKLRFGADAEVTLTHAHNTGLLLSDDSGIGTTKLSLGDSATFVQQQSDGILGIEADGQISMSATVVSMSNDLYVGGDIKAEGEITFQAGSSGNITLGSAADDNVVFTADVNSNIIPNTDDTFDLGSSSQQWKDIYIDGIGYIDQLGTDADPSTAYIGAGEIDGAVIGGESAAAGTFTTLTATTLGGALNANSQDITNIDIDSGTIDGTIIGGATPAAGTFTTLSANGDVNLGDAIHDDVNLKGHLTGSAGAHISMSLSSTGSFGRLQATTLSGHSPITVDTNINLNGDLTGSVGTHVSMSLTSTGSFGAVGVAKIMGRPGISLEGTTLSSTPSSTIDFDAGGAITIDGASVTIGGDSDTGAITADSTAGISLDAAAASNFTLSDGDLSLIADGADNKVVIKGDHTGGTAVHIDANENAASVVDIDAGVLDIDAGANVHITTATTFDVDSTGAVTIDSDGATTIGGDEIAITADGGNGNGPLTINTNDTTNGINLGDSTSGVPITIGHGTSETSIGDNLSVGGNVAIAGDLDVNGTLTTIDTANLQVKDAFVQLASGSTSQTNAGIIANTTADGKGSAFYFDGTNGYNRWALTGADETSHTATGDIVPRQFVMTVSSSVQSPAIDATPSDFGGASGNSRLGMVYVQTAATAASSSVAGDIWIYS